MKTHVRKFTSLKRALLLSGVVNVCALSWIAYCGLLQPSVHIVIPEIDEAQALTMEERLESMKLCEVETLKQVLKEEDADIEERVAAAYLLVQKKASPKAPEMIAQAPKTQRPPRQTSKPDEGLYLVQQGDSLWKIARRHRTDVDTIKQLNSLTNDSLRAGKILKLPS